jgi:hypothetical protein
MPATARRAAAAEECQVCPWRGVRDGPAPRGWRRGVARRSRRRSGARARAPGPRQPRPGCRAAGPRRCWRCPYARRAPGNINEAVSRPDTSAAPAWRSGCGAPPSVACCCGRAAAPAAGTRPAHSTRTLRTIEGAPTRRAGAKAVARMALVGVTEAAARRWAGVGRNGGTKARSHPPVGGGGGGTRGALRPPVRAGAARRGAARPTTGRRAISPARSLCQEPAAAT